MTCSSPVIVATQYGNLPVRCKQCLNCRQLKHSNLQCRMQLEYLIASSAQFLTLTFEEEPETPDYRPFSLFLKRLRSYNRRQRNRRSIRYFAVGEYGEKSGRFHFHCMIFNHLFLRQGETLTGLWPWGYVHIGEVTPSSINYIGRYSLKFVDSEDQRPFARWSRKPALGTDGMRYIMEYIVKNNIEPPDGLNCIEMGGRKYFLDKTMLDVVDEELEKVGRTRRRRHPIILSDDRVISLKLGILDKIEYGKEARQLKKTAERISSGKL